MILQALLEGIEDEEMADQAEECTEEEDDDDDDDDEDMNQDEEMYNEPMVSSYYHTGIGGRIHFFPSIFLVKNF